VAAESIKKSGVATVPIFLLVPQVKLRKRLDLARDGERAVDGVPGLIVANWVMQKIIEWRRQMSCREMRVIRVIMAPQPPS